MKCLFALLPLIALVPSAIGRPTNSSCSRWGSKHRNSTSELTNSDASEKWSTGGGKGSWNNSSDSSGSDPSGAALSASVSASSAVIVAPSADVSSAAAVPSAEASSTSLAADAALATGSASDSGSSSSSVSAVAAASTDPTSSSAATAATSSAAAGANSTDIDTLLSLHNNLRAQYGASAVTWNDTLAAYAQADASTCVYGHTNGPYGENIAAIGGSGSLDLASDFNMWANEAAQYNWNSPGYSDATGHFTQIVWKATTQIGCGWQTCGPDTIFTNFTAPSLYLVCEYVARGNIVDANNQAFIDNVGAYGS